MPFPNQEPPSLTPTQIMEYRVKFLEYFPYMYIDIDIDTNIETGWTPAEIESVVLEAFYHIPKRCSKKLDEMMINTMANLLLIKDADAENFKIGNTEPPDLVKSFEVGDISVEIKEDKSVGFVDDFWFFSKYGKRAKHLIKLCMRANIGYIV